MELVNKIREEILRMYSDACDEVKILSGEGMTIGTTIGTIIRMAMWMANWRHWLY